jgi:Zn-dependent protease
MLSQLSGVELLIVFLCIIISMAIHEAMHAFTSHWLGDTTAKDHGRLTLNPLKHIDIFTTVLLPMVLILMRLQPFFIAKPVPFNPDRVKYEEYGAALVGIVGPFINLFLAILASVLLRVFGIAVGTDAFTIFSIFIQVNLGFFVFNMIPFPPLDGSRLLYAFAPEPLRKVMYTIETGGITSIIIFMVVLFPFIGPVIYPIINSLYTFLLTY